MDKQKGKAPQRPSWLLPSKMSPPQSSVQVVDRPALTGKLDAALGARLSLILAAPGYGKTTLLALWRDRLVAKDIAVAWLTLDEEDRDASGLMAYMVWSLSHARVPVGELLEVVANDSISVPARAVLTALMQKLGAMNDDVVLVLDDYHRAQSKENDELLEFLIRHLPGNVHIVIASREVPRFDWTEFRSRGELLELGVADLQFAFAEAKVFVGKTLKLSDPQIEELLRTTEGWVLGLQLASIHMKRQTAGVEDFPGFSGRTVEVTDYLLEQVFQDQPADIQDFLLQTSVLDRFNGDLADIVCNRGDSWQVMEQLYQRNLFIFFLDQQREWCRYHHLFTDFLQERLRRRGRGVGERVHEKAAVWFGAHELIPEAVKHALQSGSLELVAQVVEGAGGWRLGITGHLPILRRVCARLPEALMRRYPRLWLGDILLSAKTGRLDDAQRKLRELGWQETNADATDELARAERMAIGVLIAGYQDRPVTLHDLGEIEQYVRQPKFDDALVLALLDNYLCLVYLDAGKFAQSIEVGRRCQDFFLRRGDDYGAKIIDTHIGQASLAQGRLTEATAIYEQIHRYTSSYPGDGGDAAAIAGVLLAETAYEQNDLEAAERHLKNSLPHIEKFDGWFDIYASGYTTAASLAHVAQGIDASMAILDRAEEIARRRNLDRLGRLVRLQRIQELAQAGDLRLAEAFAVEFEPFEDAERALGSELPSWRLAEVAGCSLANLSLRCGDLERAIAILAPRQAEAEAKGWNRSAMKLQIKLALGHDACGGQKEALEFLERSLLKAAPHNFIRCYLAEGEPMKTLLHALLRRDGPLIPAVRNFVSKILGERTAGSALFGDRQKEILDLLVKGCSTKEMAFRLGLSANTIKFHRKKLFDKLGARSRSQAIAAARKLSL